MANLWARVQRLETLFETLRVRVEALEKRVAALEQKLSQRWGQ